VIRFLTSSRPLWAVLLTVSFLSGCGMGVAAPPRRSFVIVLLDESSSFEKFWQPSVDLAAMAANRLKPGDAFAVIGVDDEGNGEDDTRVPLTLVNRGSLMSLGDKKALSKKVKALTPRKSKRDQTDILNAIQQASILADSPSVQGFKPVLLFFSDMQESRLRDSKTRSPRLPVPADIKGWKFASPGEAHCFFVNVTDWVDRSKKMNGTTWDTMVGSWVAVFNAAGLSADAKKSFHQSGAAKVEIERLFPAGF